MKSTKSPKIAPTDSRVSLAEEYLDENPDIDLIQKDPVEYSLVEGVIESVSRMGHRRGQSRLTSM
jgi:hypothetical protein